MRSSRVGSLEMNDDSHDSLQVLGDRLPSYELQQQILERHAPFVLVDRTGIIRMVNEKLELLSGYDRRELLGCSVEKLVPEELRERHVQHRESYNWEPRYRPMGIGLDLHLQRRDGSMMPIEIELSPLRTLERGETQEYTLAVISSKKRADG